MLDRVPEHEHLDFKEVASRASKFDEDDRRNLAETLGGFANSGGGVVIWGIRDPGKQRAAFNAKVGDGASRDADAVQWTPGLSADEAAELEKTFLHHLHEVVHPPLQDVAFEQVLDAASNRAALVMYVPSRGRGPVRSDAAKRHRCYYMRAGSSFAPIPHEVLSRMFGAEAVADVHVTFIAREPAAISKTDADRGTAWAEVDVYLMNSGEGFADRPYVLVDGLAGIIRVGEAGCDLKERAPARIFRSPQRTSVVTLPEVTIPPGGALNIASLKVTVDLAYFDANLRSVPAFQVTCGAKTGLANVVRVRAGEGWRETTRAALKQDAPTARIWNALFPNAPMLSHWLDLGPENDGLFKPTA